ncbi:c-type cytochrome [Bacillaceae bacterium W0354]
MKRNAVFPYALIAVLGIFGMIVLGGVGLAQTDHAEGAGEEEEVEMDPESIYQNNCMQCHGGDLSGGLGPSLNDVGERHNMEELVEIIANGVEGSAVMTGDYATDEQAKVLAEWLLEGQ